VAGFAQVGCPNCDARMEAGASKPPNPTIQGASARSFLPIAPTGFPASVPGPNACWTHSAIDMSRHAPMGRILYKRQAHYQAVHSCRPALHIRMYAAKTAAAQAQRLGLFHQRLQPGAAWSQYKTYPVGYPRGESWDQMLEQGIYPLERSAQDDHVRIRNPRRNLQINFSRPIGSRRHSYSPSIDRRLVGWIATPGRRRGSRPIEVIRILGDIAAEEAGCTEVKRL